MNGIQEAVCLGLRLLANKVEAGVYGEGDDAFQGDDDCDGHAFLADMCDEVTGKME